MSVASAPLLYFGKLPSRGDFVRSASVSGLIQTLDRWLTGGIEMLANDPRWRLVYDRAEPLHFAFLGSRSTRGMAGHLRVSTDASGRRFPFLVATMLELSAPLDYLSHSPLLLAQPWRRMDGLVRQALAAEEASTLLQDLNQTQLDVPTTALAYQRPYQAFLEDHSVGTIEGFLAADGHDMSLRASILGLGLLLQPVPASGVQRLDKGLLLPLPADPLAQAMVASMWMDLIAGFLAKADFELTVFIPQRGPGEKPVMALAFDGASPATLRALWDPEALGDSFVDACQADWVEGYVEQDYAVKKLSSYLRQSGLSMRLAVDTFKEVFLGL